VKLEGVCHVLTTCGDSKTYSHRSPVGTFRRIGRDRGHGFADLKRHGKSRVDVLAKDVHFDLFRRDLSRMAFASSGFREQRRSSDLS